MVGGSPWLGSETGNEVSSTKDRRNVATRRPRFFFANSAGSSPISSGLRRSSNSWSGLGVSKQIKQQAVITVILTRIDDHFPKVSDHGTGRLIESKIPAQFIHACDALPYGIEGLAPPPRIVLLVSSVNTMENGHELLEGVLL